MTKTYVAALGTAYGLHTLHISVSVEQDSAERFQLNPTFKTQFGDFVFTNVPHSHSTHSFTLSHNYHEISEV